MNILHIQSSILGANSISNLYSSRLVERIRKAQDRVILRDLALQEVTPLSSDVLLARSNKDHPVTQEHDQLIAEIQSADAIVIGAPMYNFNISTLLKNYFDAITQAGKTFRYNDQGQPEGFLKNKKVYVVLTRGGRYKDQNFTFQEDYLKMQLGFLGIHSVDFIFLEGLAMGLEKTEVEAVYQDQVKPIDFSN